MCGVPMLDYTLAQLRSHGHEQVLVNAHHLWEQVAAWCDRKGTGLQVELPEILGTGGGLKVAEDRLAEKFVVVNADILCDVDLGGLLQDVPERGAAMALRESPDWESIGPVTMKEGRICRITSLVGEGGNSGTHFTGVHAMSREALNHIPEGFQCVVRTAYIELVGEGRVAGRLHPGTWVDVGTPEAYLDANLGILDGNFQVSISPWDHGRRGEGAVYIGEGARIEGDVRHSVVGADSVVPAGARLRDCVVWDGAEVPAGDHERCIFYDEGGILQLSAAPTG
jgi:NDP-sugar pyrophosphorylase family protein